MNTFFIEWHDPLLGILVFFLLLFIISFLSYWWGRYKALRTHKELESFLGSFENTLDPKPIASQIHNNTLNNESWLFLAQSFEQQGNFEKSVEIYQALLTKHKDSLSQKETLLLLGKAYLKAGFLERSRITFLQVLQTHPRTPVALQHLILVYEQLQQFDKALEVMESLAELQPSSASLQTYLECRQILINPTLSTEEKSQRLADMYESTRTMGYLIFDYLFKHNTSLAWQKFDHALAPRLTDILWSLKKDQLDLDIISRNGYLRELFSAKGYVTFSTSSSNFEFDLLIAIQACSLRTVTLQFEYSCDECKQISFLPFHRCGHCHAIDTLYPIASLTKEHSEENNSFQ